MAAFSRRLLATLCNLACLDLYPMYIINDINITSVRGIDTYKSSPNVNPIHFFFDPVGFSEGSGISHGAPHTIMSY